MVQRQQTQYFPTRLTAYSGAFLAGCTISRTSTTSSVYSSVDIICSPATQGIIALSFGASEFYAVLKTSSFGLRSEGNAARQRRDVARTSCDSESTAQLAWERLDVEVQAKTNPLPQGR